MTVQGDGKAGFGLFSFAGFRRCGLLLAAVPTATRHLSPCRLSIAAENHVQSFGQNLLHVLILFNGYQAQRLRHLGLEVPANLSGV